MGNSYPVPGSQKISVQFLAPVDSSVVNKLANGALPVGVYSGGVLSYSSNTVTVAPLVAQIADNSVAPGPYQVRVETTIPVVVGADGDPGVATGTPYIVLRWTYAESDTNSVSILGVTTPAATDVVLGKALFDGGSNIIGFDYALRTIPQTLSCFGLVFLASGANRQTFVNNLHVVVAGANVAIPGQLIQHTTPAAAQLRVDLIYVNDAGVVTVLPGTAAGSNPVAPVFPTGVPLALVTVKQASPLTTTDIQDVRGFFAVSSGLVKDYILIHDEKSSGTEGGGAVSNDDWETRALNTEVQDTGSHASVSANRITLLAGTYRFKIRVPARNVGNHRARLKSISGTTVEIYGTSEKTGSTDIISHSVISGRVVLAATTVLEVQHRVNSKSGNQDYGMPATMGVNELYTVAEFWREV